MSTVTTTNATRTIEGVELPRAGTWTIDQAHSSVEVVARHMVIAKVRGAFERFSGTIQVADAPEDSAVEFVIDATSIHTGDERRDDHLRGADFLETDTYPEIAFRSTSIEAGRKKGHWSVTGNLSVRDVTRPVTLDVEFEGVGSAYGGPRAVFTSEFEVDREDFGLTWNMALEAGGVLVGRQLRIELSLQAVPGQPAA